ncbi:endolytic transglycosylase MltG [Maribacter sp.]|uniref:endolytic transglycosylase MltG n=1 Tax=Maribacter sp. TaxID=1897614 RepID=UPI0025C48050|nr:endolytic transglycosylase MltG [Maribacter sp.]
MYIKKILVAIVLVGLVAGGILAYTVYDAFFTPNTKFNNDKAYVFIPTNSNINDVEVLLEPILEDISSFLSAAERKKYSVNVKAGKYALKKGMNNNEIIGVLRSGNTPVKVAFNNQETIADLAGRISKQIEADSLSLLSAFTDASFLKENGFNADTNLAMYIANSYEFFWNTSPEGFRNKMLKEYAKFWNENRLKKAKALNLTPIEVVSLAAIVHKETAKIDERPRVAGLYLNRIRKGMLLQADPTVIYALKKDQNNFGLVIKRVLYKDLEIDSPYNTYKYTGVPPGPITMPDISAIDAVLSSERHEYIYMVANVENFGYHKFARTAAQHNRNKVQYVRWINAKKINR